MDIEKNSNGAFLGLIIIIIILVLGGIYVWHRKIKQLGQQKIQSTATTAKNAKTGK